MPEFPKRETILTHDEALNSILTSIAMEEAALSHILNAEGEKIQNAVKRMEKSTNIAEIMCVNESVTTMIGQIIDLQIILKNKLRLAEKFISNIPGKKPDHKPEKPPIDPCSSSKPSQLIRSWND